MPNQTTDDIRRAQANQQSDAPPPAGTAFAQMGIRPGQATRP